ncbi:putative dna repair helicase protein [Botrytis fragariae]|uniref:Putative dna repair helicase protein n=1 Tax=Botrytis fragariae TaxID=1964551 RepID=A0A8H6AMM4_9HELO|nr:putative dna repair helicase protein [Botrytis fragariae]KAF5870204.1 putative dna repair helicase protein [Botrytis fragariae]
MESSVEVRKPKTAAEMLLFSEDHLMVDKLTGVNIPFTTYQSLKKMAPYLGLPNANAVSDFLKSPEFHRHYDLLYESAIQPRILREPNSKGPSLKTVQSMIMEGEAYGDCKYSDPDTNMKGWQDADHYALCLYRLCVFNSTRRNGIFLNRNMSTTEKQVRLWMCIVRATSDANRLITRTKAQKQKSLSIDEDSSVRGLLDQPPSAGLFRDNSGTRMPDIYSTPNKSRKQHQFSSPQSTLVDKPNHPMRILDQAALEAAEHVNDPFLEHSLRSEDLSQQGSS